MQRKPVQIKPVQTKTLQGNVKTFQLTTESAATNGAVAKRRTVRVTRKEGDLNEATNAILQKPN